MLHGPLRLNERVRMLVQLHVEPRVIEISCLGLIDGLFTRLILCELILIVKRLVEMGCLIVCDASGALSLDQVNRVICEVMR